MWRRRLLYCSPLRNEVVAFRYEALPCNCPIASMVCFCVELSASIVHGSSSVADLLKP
jgi:hypothetical protein